MNIFNICVELIFYYMTYFCFEKKKREKKNKRRNILSKLLFNLIVVTEIRRSIIHCALCWRHNDHNLVYELSSIDTSHRSSYVN